MNANTITIERTALSVRFRHPLAKAHVVIEKPSLFDDGPSWEVTINTISVGTQTLDEFRARMVALESVVALAEAECAALVADGITRIAVTKENHHEEVVA